MQRLNKSCTLAFIIVLVILLGYHYDIKEVKRLVDKIITKNRNTKVIIAFGDSLTEGLFDWPKSRKFHPYTIKLQQLIDDKIKSGTSELQITVQNAGVSGERLRKSMKQRLRRIVQSANPDLVIILGGTNDLLDIDKEASDYNDDSLASNLLQDIQSLHLYCHYKGIPTAALSIPETAIDDRSANGTVAKLRRIVNKELRDFVTRNLTKSIFVDISDEIKRKGNEEYWDDGVHFSPLGYDRMGEIIYREIKRMIEPWIS